MNRRGFLARLGLGAAGAALVPEVMKGVVVSGGDKIRVPVTFPDWVLPPDQCRWCARIQEMRLVDGQPVVVNEGHFPECRLYKHACEKCHDLGYIPVMIRTPRTAQAYGSNDVIDVSPVECVTTVTCVCRLTPKMRKEVGA